jgi:hypothetical protein
VLKNFFTGTTKHIHMGEKKEEEESEEDVSVSMHGRLRVSSQRLDFGLPNDINDLENGTRQGQVQYRLQAVAVRDLQYCMHVKVPAGSMYVC